MLEVGTILYSWKNSETVVASDRGVLHLKCKNFLLLEELSDFEQKFIGQGAYAPSYFRKVAILLEDNSILEGKVDIRFLSLDDLKRYSDDK